MSLELKDFMDGKTDAVSLRDKYLKNINKNKKKTRVALITPNVIGSKTQIRRVQPPLGIACLAAVLDDYGFKALKIIDSSAEGYNNVQDLEGDFIEFGLELKSTKFIRGDVLQTLQDSTNVPDKISILRLDTDWYESTKFELEILYPKLVIGGVLIVDDYGHWSGARQAVDEYFKDKHIPLLNIIDYTGRMAIKTYVC